MMKARGLYDSSHKSLAFFTYTTLQYIFNALCNVGSWQD